MADEQWNIIQSNELLSGIVASSGLAWSTESQLALLTTRGLIIYDLLPNATNPSTALNIKATLLLYDESEEANPVISRLAAKFRLEEYVCQFGNGGNMTFTLDNAMPVVGKPLEGMSNRKQISYVKWSPANAMGEQKPMLATLNVSHRVRIFCHRLAWEPVCDITKLLYDHLVCEHWNLECKINYETTRGNEEMVKLLSRCYLLSTTVLAWSDVTMTNADVNTTILVTGQKSGHLVVWSFKFPGKNSDGLSKFFKIESVVETDLGVLTCLLWVQIGKIFVLFVGCQDGRIKAFKVDWTTENVQLLDLGFVWNEKDRLAITVLEAIDDDTTKRGDFELFVAKSFFGIRIRLKLEADGIVVTGKSVKKFGGSKIGAVTKVCSSRYVVFCTEGPPKFFSTTEKDFEIHDFDFNGCPALDFRNQSCHGFVGSCSGSIFALLQNSGLDNPKPKGKLTFLARNLDLMADLLKLVRPVPDQFEVFRIAIINGFETDENLAKNILALVKENALTKTNWQATMWLCQLMSCFTARVGTDDVSREFDEIFDLLFREALCENAFKKLKDDSRQLQEDVRASMAAFISDYCDDESIKTEVDQMKIDKLKWTCKLCGKGHSEEFRIDSFVCESGHRFVKCFRTLKSCDEFKLVQCQWCYATSLPTDPNIFPDKCLFCTGPIC